MQTDTIFLHSYSSPVGELILGDFNNQLCLCDWQYRKMRKEVDKRLLNGLQAAFETQLTPLLQETVLQLEAYFNQKLTHFDLPLLLVGTNFQQTVWKALQHIDYGKTQTYLGLSKQLNNPKAIRAVASANGANAISIIIPCHRIVGSNQELIGYAGGLSVKQKLLALERGSELTLF
jgi:methylated-DNA-[protein]-cysteine S-methyltransferase